MKTKTALNIENRIQWLNDIIKHFIKPSSLEAKALNDLKTFFNTALLEGSLSKIAYNTVKKHTLDNRLMGTPRNYANSWEYLKDLRSQAHGELIARNRLAEVEALPKELEKRALLEAHICSMAYLEIYQFLNALLKEPIITEYLRLRISNQLLIFSEKFSHITSHSPRDGISLQLVTGGKAK
ncbi:hypothetical protein QN412_23825 [Pseudomonas sp. RTB3]|uniref:hypothetical protein n=1 Tax=unclassified Pseudomonas TaxID=196821 RepID=UPI002B2238AC|nr:MULTISPECIES: hypothetical protein [unclassified Pseudomonas]MEB0008545.1 hypothetical protein [Pseudomonas sp. RTB2]MEB0019955.1 hypothetical protein [Pseudomonas sp. RTB3]